MLNEFFFFCNNLKHNSSNQMKYIFLEKKMSNLQEIRGKGFSNLIFVSREKDLKIIVGTNLFTLSVVYWTSIDIFLLRELPSSKSFRASHLDICFPGFLVVVESSQFQCGHYSMNYSG